jgi:CBS domain-containing protein
MALTQHLCQREIAVATGDLPLDQAAALLRNARISDVPVVEPTARGPRFVGLLTGASLILGARGELESLRVADIMLGGIRALREHDGRAALLDWFRAHGASRAPVVDSRGMLVGVVAFADVVEHFATALVREPLTATESLIIDLDDDLPVYTA